jgi:putative glutamine amidotransferase
VRLNVAYTDAVRSAGGMPLVVPPGTRVDAELVAGFDAVVLTGGAFDIHPSHYGAAVLGRLDAPSEDRTLTELDLARHCLAHDVPILGVCGGLQALAVAAGGTLIQDIGSEVVGALQHEQLTDPAAASHTVAASGWLAERMGVSLQVNSTHHQAVADPGPFEVVGRAPDGVIEALVLPGHRCCVGVQWHPELLGDFRLYEALLRA